MTVRLLPAVPPLCALAFLAACQTNSRQQIPAMDKSQVALRAVQTRAFDTTDTTLTVRTMVASLQRSRLRTYYLKIENFL